MAESVRHRILTTMIAKFQAVEPPDWPIKFSTVELGPLGEADHRKRFSIGIVPGPERYSHLYPYTVRNMTVGIEFRITVNRDDPFPGHLGEMVLTVVEQVVSRNRQWDGLAVDTQLTNNEIDMTTYGDRTVMGVLWIEVQFRHSTDEPTDPNPTI